MENENKGNVGVRTTDAYLMSCVEEVEKPRISVYDPSFVYLIPFENPHITVMKQAKMSWRESGMIVWQDEFLFYPQVDRAEFYPQLCNIDSVLTTIRTMTRRDGRAAKYMLAQNLTTSPHRFFDLRQKIEELNRKIDRVGLVRIHALCNCNIRPVLSDMYMREIPVALRIYFGLYDLSNESYATHRALRSLPIHAGLSEISDAYYEVNKIASKLDIGLE